jgi:peptide/nickel transport system substrate-binding protein
LVVSRIVVGAAVVAAATACAAVALARPDAAPQRGGTLVMLGTGDVVNLDTLAAYYIPNNTLDRGYARQLFSYPNAKGFLAQTKLVADVATAVPTRANGGISADGKTYTIHIKQGVQWGTTPPRQVTAEDFVRQVKMLCNPAAPAGAPGYFTSTIAGMSTYCSGFSKVKPIVPAIKAYVNAHELSGVEAQDPLTLVFHLTAPAPDFPNILAMGFVSARPIEYMQYVPDSAEFRQHTISDGPYKITRYKAAKEIELERNPAWKQSTDTLRHAYVDAIKITEGLSSESVQQQLETGSGDLEWDIQPPSQRIPSLLASHDARLTIGPTGPYYSVSAFFSQNTYAGPFKKRLVRQAAAYALDRRAIVRILGGSAVAEPASQVVLPGNVGYVNGWRPYLTSDGTGNAAKAKALLATAGYPNGVSITLLTSNAEPGPRIAQSAQASLAAAGFKVKILQVSTQDEYGKYLFVPASAKRDAWDLAWTGWVPDWFGNNGRTTLQPLFTAPGNGSVDFGGYNDARVNALVDSALHAKSAALAARNWTAANRRITSDAVVLVAAAQKWPVFHSARVQNCVWWWYVTGCDPTNVWLSR